MGATKPIASGKIQPAPGPSPRTARAGFGSKPVKKGKDSNSGAKHEKPVQTETRDPRLINDHVKVNFEDVLGEPDGVRSLDCCWIKSVTCYTCCKNFLYKVASFLFGFPLATIYGCTFACTAFPHVWILTPFAKMFQICCHPISRIFKYFVLCFIGAPCEICGEFFSAFKSNGGKIQKVQRKRGGVTFNEKVKTKRIPSRNVVGVKEQQISRLQAVRKQR